jgi:hypothetical protein
MGMGSGGGQRPETGATSEGGTGAAAADDWRCDAERAYRETVRKVEEAVAVSTRAADGQLDRPDGLLRVARALRDRIEAHLDFERQEILPRLTRLGSLHTAKVVRLTDAHRRLRETLETLGPAADPSNDPSRLGFAVETVAREVLDYLEVNIRELLVPEVLNDDPVMADQQSG